MPSPNTLALRASAPKPNITVRPSTTPFINWDKQETKAERKHKRWLRKNES